VFIVRTTTQDLTLKNLNSSNRKFSHT